MKGRDEEREKQILLHNSDQDQELKERQNGKKVTFQEVSLLPFWCLLRSFLIGGQDTFFFRVPRSYFTLIWRVVPGHQLIHPLLTEMTGSLYVPLLLVLLQLLVNCFSFYAPFSNPIVLGAVGIYKNVLSAEWKENISRQLPVQQFWLVSLSN